MQLWDIYHTRPPAFLLRLAQTPEMARLAGVGMNCGCEYTGFARFRDLGPYSRLDHSVGVALILWHFTADPVQTIAGLFHDIATPVFAHVVDFLKGDYMTQEATEAGTRERIERSAEIRSLLRELDIEPELVADYHRFPVADNDTPRLSADRLEYTMGNLVNFSLASRGDVRGMYEDLVVGENEIGQPELMFQTPETALAFARGALLCSRIYVSDEDRYAMQILSELLRDAITAGILSPADLDTTEPEVIRTLQADPDLSPRFYCKGAQPDDHGAGAGQRVRVETDRRQATIH